jgi:hypothetical protein
MTKPTDVDREIPVPRAAADARESAAGADAATSTTRAFEGTHKQTADTNVEELLALLSGLAGGNDKFMEAINRLNAKRTYDQAQSFDQGVQYNDVISRQRINQVAEQALQNAVETANMVGKQAVRHAEIAIDRQWNVDEQGYTVAEILRDNTFKEAIAATVANALKDYK